MDIYIVTDGDLVVGASAKLQGAELIRTNYACGGIGLDGEDHVYNRCRITNVGLHDYEDE